ncbi:hypothetical protein ES703_93488 [subsurface metagenome]
MMSSAVFIAVHTRPGKIAHLCVWKILSVCDFIQLHPGDSSLLVCLIRPDRHVVLGRTGDHARPTSCALIQINDHAVPISITLFLFHVFPRF